MTAYIALLRKDQGSDYGMGFPDFPGCVTAGTTLEDWNCFENQFQYFADDVVEDFITTPGSRHKAIQEVSRRLHKHNENLHIESGGYVSVFDLRSSVFQ